MRVLLVDDHRLFVEGLAGLLAARGIEVVGTAGDGLAALGARELHPDLILMDIQMPRCDGLAATRLIKAELPETKVVMLTVADEDELLFTAIRNGAAGYLLKSLEADEFMRLLMGLTNGEAPFVPGLTARVLKEFARMAARGGTGGLAVAGGKQRELSPRQLQILSLVARGMTYKQVGSALCLSERTIKYHMGEIIAQLRLKSRAQAVAWARRAGLAVSSDELH